MPTQVLICDDSNVARKQMARTLPSDWDMTVHFAANGAEGIDAIKDGRGEVLFLDLNMPVMDGYEVLQAIRDQDLPAMVIVVSGDIQPEAYQRVMALGALDFIKKPASDEQIADILLKYGVYTKSEVKLAPQITGAGQTEYRDAYQEIANVAMGRAGDLLARLLDVFVILDIPSVNMLDSGELKMALTHVDENETVSAVCQGFIGYGIAGEAFLIFNESSYSDISELLKCEDELDETLELELLMDVSNVLVGACLKGVADQLDINFSQGQPVVLGRHVTIADIIKRNASRWDEILAIEISYSIENRNINCDLMLLFTGDSLAALNARAKFLIE